MRQPPLSAIEARAATLPSPSLPDRVAAWLYSPRPRSQLLIQLALALLYFAIGIVSYRFSNIDSPLAGTFYLHEGYGLALGATFGIRVLPGIFVGHFALVLFQGLPIEHAMLSSAENILVLYASLKFLRLLHFRASLARPVDFLSLLAASLLTFQVLSRLAGFLTLFVSGHLHTLHVADIIATVSESLVDESICQVLVAATLLTSLDQIRRGRSIRYWLSGLAITTILMAGLATVLWGKVGHVNPLHVFSLEYLIVMTITFLFGLHGASFSNLTALVVMQWANHQQTGPFFQLLASQDQQDNISTVLLGVIISSSLVGALLREKEDKERALVELATRDALTGLYNRRYFFEAARRELGRAKRQEMDILLLCLDLDHFKHINDAHGHAAGDEVLEAVGEILQQASRRADVAARMGGEEFAILACDTADAESIADRLRGAIRQRLDHNPSLIKFTVSIGVTRVRRDDDDIASVLKRADDALYEAKHLGRDCVVVRP